MPRHTAPASFLPLRKFSHYYMQFICVAAATNLQTGCVTNYDPNTDYFPEKIDGCMLSVPAPIASKRLYALSEIMLLSSLFPLHSSLPPSFQTSKNMDY
ncbi:hypothetical protein BCR33DRAFT_724255 [Rhizoclosmatium globosum]|uniref:Uncharacterized protein n=1 Tax=Rhizoclosmatium globosum TaxID=329046 RepID=A0A1Y2B891_9FUNG|nr:hypothetical protein BCR33DRAFT_724255 [Rhizoclosmatium globosum]|eukprot:ORY30717.1 hypothetical protein BCR33DRAFT_724255 [Rhizoclosmatium globosum]